MHRYIKIKGFEIQEAQGKKPSSLIKKKNDQYLLGLLEQHTVDHCVLQKGTQFWKRLACT